jgi:membrane-bound lytic murein transglycosylase D
MRPALRLLATLIGFGFGLGIVTAYAADNAPAAAVTAAKASPSAPMMDDNALDVVLEYLPFPPTSEDLDRPPVAAITLPKIDLWQRIRAGFAIPDLETRLADQRTRWYADQVEYFARMTQRSSRYLYFIVEEIERRGMPTELALLPFVESAFQPEAVSSAKAAGLWQFIPSTGRVYDLEQNMWKDERRSVVDSTRAALDYLQKLYDMFGDWHLALAAYNWGEGSVSRAIDKNRRAGRPTGYTSLKMPTETQHYVPKLQAVKNIVAEPEKFGIALPPVPNSPYFVAIQKTRDIDVRTAARLAEMSPDEFRSLNPQFNRPVIVGAGAPTLLLPTDRVAAFNANLAAWEATGQPLASWTTYTTKPADSLAGIAQRAGIDEQRLREANRIPPRYRIAAGSTILIPRDETMADIAPASLDGRFALVPESANLRKITYRVRRGDTLHSVARRYRVEERDVIVWNQLTSPTLFAGQRLELTVPVAKSRAPAKAATRPATAARKSAATTAKSPAKAATGKAVAAR